MKIEFEVNSWEIPRGERPDAWVEAILVDEVTGEHLFRGGGETLEEAIHSAFTAYRRTNS